MLFSAVAIFFPRGLMCIYASDAEMIGIGAAYLKVVAPTYLLSGISQCYMSIMKISGRAAQSMIIATVTVVVDVVVDVFLVYGLCGLPKLGAVGSAGSTLMVCIVEVIWVIAESCRRDHIRPDIQMLGYASENLRKDMVSIGSPILLSSLVWGIGFTTYSAIIGHLGSDAAAAFSIAAVIKDLMFCFCQGLASGAGILIGKELGNGALEKAKRDGARLSRLSIGFGIFFAILLLVLSQRCAQYVAVFHSFGIVGGICVGAPGYRGLYHCERG